jgi:hypothetical protein
MLTQRGESAGSQTADGATSDAEQFCDLGVVEALVVAQHQDGALLVRQACHHAGCPRARVDLVVTRQALRVTDGDEIGVERHFAAHPSALARDVVVHEHAADVGIRPVGSFHRVPLA